METLYGNTPGWETFYLDDIPEYWDWVDKTGAPMTVEAADALFRSGKMTDADLEDFVLAVAGACECGFYMDIYVELGDAGWFLALTAADVLLCLDLDDRESADGFRYHICQWGAYRMLIGGYDC